MTEIQIKVGQVWGDCDPRQKNRFLLIETVGEAHVQCQVLRTGKKTVIRVDRLKPCPSGYYLAVDPEILAEVQNQLAEAKQRQPAPVNTLQTTNTTQAKAVSIVQPSETTGS